MNTPPTSLLELSANMAVLIGSDFLGEAPSDTDMKVLKTTLHACLMQAVSQLKAVKDKARKRFSLTLPRLYRESMVLGASLERVYELPDGYLMHCTSCYASFVSAAIHIQGLSSLEQYQATVASVRLVSNLSRTSLCQQANVERLIQE